MKKASRFMPKYTSPPTSMVGWIILALILAFFVWLFYSAPILLVVLPFVALFLYSDNKKRKAHFQELLSKREHYSICEFSKYFDCKEIDTWVIRAVYEQLQDYLKSEHEQFPVLPEDDIFIDLKIDDEDFEYDIVEEISSRTGRTLMNVGNNPYYGKANIVKNLVYFFNEQPVVNAT